MTGWAGAPDPRERAHRLAAMLAAAGAGGYSPGSSRSHRAQGTPTGPAPD
ncbi:hypothetical protein [Streptomyces rhizoryzae]